MRWSESKVQAPQFACGVRHQMGQLVGGFDVAGLQIESKGLREGFDKRTGFVIQARGHQLRTHGMGLLRTTPGNAVFIGQSQHQTFFAIQLKRVWK